MHCLEQFKNNPKNLKQISFAYVYKWKTETNTNVNAYYSTFCAKTLPSTYENLAFDRKEPVQQCTGSLPINDSLNVYALVHWSAILKIWIMFLQINKPKYTDMIVYYNSL